MVGQSHDPSSVVDVHGAGQMDATHQIAQIDGRTATPQNGTFTAANIGAADHLPGAVDSVGPALCAAEGAEIDGQPVSPECGMYGSTAGNIGPPSGLPAVVDCSGLTAKGSQGAQGRWCRTIPYDRTVIPRRRSRPSSNLARIIYGVGRIPIGRGSNQRRQYGGGRPV